jgi:hypothetical protein
VKTQIRHRARGMADLDALSYRFSVQCDDNRLEASIAALLEGLRHDDAPADNPDEGCCYSLRAQADDTVDVWRDAEAVALALQVNEAVAWLVRDVTRRAAEAGRDHLLIHAAGVQDGKRGVLLPGPSGSGKSTLAAGLVRSGLAYLSDELVALEIGSGRLLPYAKPISLKHGSRSVLRDMVPPAPGGADDGSADQEILLAVGTSVGRPVGVACRPELLVVPRYEPGRTTRFVPLSETEAFAALAVNTVNLVEHGATGVQALGELATRCERVALTMSDLDEAVALVRGLL